MWWGLLRVSRERNFGEMKFFQIDAFASDVFRGNPAGVVPLDAWVSKDLMLAIAAENNISETAFFVPQSDEKSGHYDLRWFTPSVEVDLCGHATLASAYVVFTYLQPDLDMVSFDTRSGVLQVRKADDGWMSMDLPVIASEPLNDKRIESVVHDLLGVEAVALRRSANLIVILDTQAQVEALQYTSAIGPALKKIGFWGMMVTAPGVAGGDADFVSRFFAPEKGIPEDPVTGSAHCAMTPYWADRLGKTELVAHQVSARGGQLRCELTGDRVILYGQCTPYLEGVLKI